jgi:hypothetical protein
MTETCGMALGAMVLEGSLAACFIGGGEGVRHR